MRNTSLESQFIEWEKDLPRHLDSESLVIRCWKNMRASAKRCGGDNGYHSLLLLFAVTREQDITQCLSGSKENIAAFEKLLITIEDLYLPLLFLQFERIKFHDRARKLDENFEEYLKTLEKLILNCEFGSGEREILKEQFLRGGNLPSVLRQKVEHISFSNLKQVLALFSNHDPPFCDQQENNSMPKFWKSQKQPVSLTKDIKENNVLDLGQHSTLMNTGKEIQRNSHRLALRAASKSLKKEKCQVQDEQIPSVNTVLLPLPAVEPTSVCIDFLVTPEITNVFLDDGNVEINKPKKTKRKAGKAQSKHTKEKNIARRKSVKMTRWNVTDSPQPVRSRIEDKSDNHCANKQASLFSEELNESSNKMTSGLTAVSEDLHQGDTVNSKARNYDQLFENVPSELVDKDRENLNDKKESSSSTFLLPIDNFSYRKKKGKDSFQCKVCREFFPLQYLLEEHIKMHPSTCCLCGKKFPFPSRLYKHISKHTGKKFAQGKTFEGQNERKGRYHEEYTCSKCAMKIRGKRLFNRHMNEHNLYCDICDKMIDCKSTFTIHMNGHKGKRPYQCTSCSRSFTRKSDLKVHAQIHNPSREKNHVCDYCGKNFFRVHELERHRKLHSSDKPYKCGICLKSFPTAHGLKSHSILHTGIKSFMCEKCGVSFAQKSNLATHLMRHSGVKEHECATCGLKFARKCYLESHKRSHTKEKPFSCETCGACVSSRYSLRRHKLVHTGKKPHLCIICNEAFTWQSTFKKHMESHGDAQFMKPPKVSRYGSHEESNISTAISQSTGEHSKQQVNNSEARLQGNQILQSERESEHVNELNLEMSSNSEEKVVHPDMFFNDTVEEQALNLQLDKLDCSVSNKAGIVPIGLSSLQQAEEGHDYLPIQHGQTLFETHSQQQQNHMLEVQPQNNSPATAGAEFHHQSSVQVLRTDLPRVYNLVIQSTNNVGVFDTIVVEQFQSHDEKH